MHARTYDLGSCSVRAIYWYMYRDPRYPGPAPGSIIGKKKQIEVEFERPMHEHRLCTNSLPVWQVL